MPGAEKVRLEVELVEKNAEARLKALDKLAKEMGNRKITLNFDEASLQRWKTATEGMTNAQLSAYAKLAVGAENAAAKVVAADVKANQKRVSDEQKTNAKILADRQKSFDKKVELYEKEDTKRRQSAEKTAQTEINARAKVEVATIKGATGVRKLKTETDALNTSSKQTDSIWSSLMARFTAANLISSAITAGISRLRSALREAVSEMKEMDKELTTIKMVSGASDYEISQLRDQAFAGARANGRSVTDYLSAAEMFTRAGYRDNIDQLSQLALMTQNIGGVEEEVAGKFLLAADAAWKLGGNYESLMGVLDGVSSVADQNATDLGKIAEGITIAGTAMANAGVSAKEFTAMLGLTTASTQRSGSEMARGLRTILFRVRQVKAEFDDGEVINADDISNAAKALKEVADIDVIDKQTNDLKSFSKIMSELAEKWVTLDDKQKQYLQNALAGNRQGNVLFAWLENWDKYEELMQQYEDSAGTALEKNAIFTESWAASTNNLKTAWTELVGTMTENGGLLQGFVDNIATPLIDKMSAFAHELQREDGIIWFFKNLGNYEWAAAPDGNFRLRRKDILEEDAKALEKAKKATEESGEAAEGASGKIIDYSGAVDGAGDSADEAAGKIDKVTTAFEKQRTKISEVAKAIKEEKNDAVDSLADIYKSAMEAAQSGYYGSNAFQQGGSLFFSKTNLNIIRNGGKLDAQEYLEAYFKEIESGDYADAAANFVGKITHGTNEIKDANGEILASVKDVGEGYEWVFDKGSMSMDDYLTSLEKSTGIASTFWVSMMDSLGLYSDELSEWASQPETPKKVEVDTDDATKQVNNLKTLLGSIEDREVRINVVTAYYTAGGGSTGQHAAGTQAKIDLTRGTNSYAWSGAGSASVDKFIPGKAGGKRDNYSGIALVNDEFPANGSKPELIISKSNGTAYIANGGRPALVSLASDDIVLTANETKNALGIPGFEEGKNGLFTTKVSDGLSKGSSTSFFVPKGKATKGSSGSAASSATSADATDTWNQLKKLIDYMVEEQKGILDQNLKVLDKQLEELEATRKAQKDEDELTEKQLKVDEALLELQKAQNERTVRYYNESTHQWEWMADQGVLAQAEEAYSDALKELKDFLSDLDFNEQKAAIQAQKDALQEAFDAYKEGWDLIVQSIEKPTGDLAALFAELKTNGTEAMQSQADNISSLLSALELGFFYGIGDVTGNANSGIGDVTTAASSGIGDVTGAASSGITEVVNRANAFLESVKQAENNAKAAEQAKSSSGGGGGSGSGSGGGGSGDASKKETVLKSNNGNSISKAVSNLASTLTSEAVNIASKAVGNVVYKATNSTSTVNNNGNNTYINGVKIGSGAANMTLGQVLSTLNIHANMAK